MTATKSLPLPRDTTRQSQAVLYGRWSKRLNRICGSLLMLFLVVHVAGLAVVYWDALKPVLDIFPWLDGVNERTWFRGVYAVLFPAIAFHTLYSLKLIAMDFGLRINYKASFWVISALAVASGLWGAFGYGSH